MTSVKIAVIGAGVSGLSFASRILNLLPTANVHLFDKARAVGGRCSTRRVDDSDVQFDHGAQYFTATDELFRKRVQDWQKSGVVAEWKGRIAKVDGKHAGRIESTPTHERFVGVPSMSALPKLLYSQILFQAGEQSIELRTECRVTRLQHIKDENVVRLFGADDDELGDFQYVVLTPPPAQTLELINGTENAEHACLSETIADKAKSAPLQPCFALMLTLGKLPRCLHGVGGLFINNSDVLSWLSTQESRPKRPSPPPHAVVVHSTHGWASAHVDDHKDDVRDAMLHELKRVLAVDKLDVTADADVHRWLYAFPSAELDDQFLIDGRIAVCGDWLCGSKVQGAWLSGHHLAAALADVIQAAHPHEHTLVKDQED